MSDKKKFVISKTEKGIKGKKALEEKIFHNKDSYSAAKKLDLDLSHGFSLKNDLDISKFNKFLKLKELRTEIYHFIIPDNLKFIEAIKNLESLTLYSEILGDDNERIDLSILEKFKK